MQQQTHISYEPYKEKAFQAFFTDADEIRVLMAKLLGDVTGKSVLEPCAGHGAFIEALIGTPNRLDAIDIDENHVDYLNNNMPSWVNVSHLDFINSFVKKTLFSHQEPFFGEYDSIICNPPYGLKFSIEYRKEIKRLYPNLYARESYGLFLYFGISSLKEGGRYVFIVPDTFLTSINHKHIRQFLCEEAAPSHIIQFKSSRFETVNFAYGNFCIIAGFKKPLSKQDQVNWVNAIHSKEPLEKHLLENNALVLGAELIQTASQSWIHPEHSLDNMSENVVTLGELAECRTGIYTGDNKRFFAFNAEVAIKRTNGYKPLSWEKELFVGNLTEEQKFFGIQDKKCFVPLVRGGHRKPLETTAWAVDWSKEAISFYKTDAKARFQNSSFYFQSGLAVPMVTSGRLTASLMENCVFDQGVVGIFPKNTDMLDYLLIYLNSEYSATTIKKFINSGANNSANYIKRIPVLYPAKELMEESKSIIESAKLYGWEYTEPQRSLLMKKVLKEMQRLPI